MSANTVEHKPSRAVARAWAALHETRHRPWAGDSRSWRLLLWGDLISLREAIHGELDPYLWQRTLDRMIDAINAGRPCWPIYAEAKRGWRS